MGGTLGKFNKKQNQAGKEVPVLSEPPPKPSKPLLPWALILLSYKENSGAFSELPQEIVLEIVRLGASTCENPVDKCVTLFLNSKAKRFADCSSWLKCLHFPSPSNTAALVLIEKCTSGG